MKYAPYVGVGMLLQMVLILIDPPVVWCYSLGVAAIYISLPFMMQRASELRQVLKYESN